MTLAAFAEAVTRYGALAGASATSWFRTREHNTAVGGVAHSAHLVGLGCDVVYDGSTLSVEWRTEWAARLGLRLIPEGDHDHLQPSDWRAS